jgi:diguanylate cyclase (GGDEF)-like protein
MLDANQLQAQDAKQRLRLRRFLLASTTYAICVPLLLLAMALGLVGVKPALIAIAAIAVVNATFYFVFRTGLNLRFSEPSLTWLQIAAANTIILYCIYSFDQGRSFALMLSLVVMMFGVFRFTTRQFLTVTLYMLAGYGVVINLLMYAKPDTVNVYLEWFHWIGLAAVLPCFAFIGGRVSELRARLHKSNEELLSALAAIRQMATHDQLTDMPNRTLFNDTLQRAIARAERQKQSLAVFFMDLDRFKNINDTLGHGFGDQVLQEMGRRLLSSVCDSDFVARLGGDEFVLLVEDCRDEGNLADIANKLLAAVSKPMVVQGHELHLSLSIGICTYPADGRDPKTLLSNADIAMYSAKEQGRNSFCFYSAELNSHTLEKLELERDLRHALDRGEFRVYYQPKVNIAKGTITGVEALLRWQHPELGLLTPDRFITLAEQTGLIVPIGWWILREVCQRVKAWQSSGLPRVPVAVNLAAPQFREDQIVPQLTEILKSSGLPPDTLELEITESMVMQDPDNAAALMRTLRKMGVRLTIDDFGTGYSSLGYLKRFPINSLKVDRSFVRDLPYNADDIAITRAVIAMAHSLQMNVIAEGVEHQAQFELLRDEGCDEYQGFLCRPPLPEEELLRFLRTEDFALA